MTHIIFRVFILTLCCTLTIALNRFQAFWSSDFLFSKSLKQIIDDLSWLKSSLNFNPDWLAIKSCEDYNFLSRDTRSSLRPIRAIHRDTKHQPVETPVSLPVHTDPSFSDQLDDIWKTSGLLDSIPLLDINTVSSTTWALFFTNFVLTLILGISSIFTEQEPPITTPKQYKPRNRALYRKTKNPVEKRRLSESPRRLKKLKKRKTIQPHQVGKQLKRYLCKKDRRRQLQDVIKLRKISPRIFTKKRTKSDLEIRKRSKVKTPLTFNGKIYNLDNVEEIPWEILDILLCIKNPCYEHDHDHICVVGNNVYTIPNWSIPNTTRQTPNDSPLQYDDYGVFSYEEDLDASPNSYYSTFHPIRPATCVEITDDIEKPEAVYISQSVSTNYEIKLGAVNTTTNEYTPHNNSVISFPSIATVTPSTDFTEPIIDPIGSESTDLEDEVNSPDSLPTFKDFLIRKASDIQRNVKTMVYDTGRVIVDKISSSDKSLKKTQEKESQKLIYNIEDKNALLTEEDIGLPCANSSFKAEIDQLTYGNSMDEICFDDDVSLSWTESLYNDKDLILHDNTQRNHEEDCHVSKFINNISNRLVTDTQNIHDLSKTLSFYGDVSALELGASWIVKGLVNQVVEDLNISSRAESLVNNLSSTFSSFLHNNSVLNNTS